VFGDLRGSALPISDFLLAHAPEGSVEFHGQPASCGLKASPAVRVAIHQKELRRSLLVRFGLKEQGPQAGRMRGFCLATLSKLEGGTTPDPMRVRSAGKTWFE
jgi:hypothetical protein